MESFLKTLQELRDLLKASKSKAKMPSMHPELPKVPEIKPIPAPSISAGANSSTSAAKMPGISPGSKKDPVKVAQQLKQGKPQKDKMPLLKIDQNGQWSLDKPKKPNYGKVTVIPDKPVNPGKVTVIPDKPVNPGKVIQKADDFDSDDEGHNHQHVATLHDKSTVHYKGTHGGYNHYEVNHPKHGKYKMSYGGGVNGKYWGPNTKPKHLYASHADHENAHETHMQRAIGDHTDKLHGKAPAPKHTGPETIDTSSAAKPKKGH